MAIRKPDPRARTDRDHDFEAALRHAEHAFGDPAVARAWFGRPNSALSGKTPEAVLARDGGFVEVDAVLTRIEHGVIS